MLVRVRHDIRAVRGGARLCAEQYFFRAGEFRFCELYGGNRCGYPGIANAAVVVPQHGTGSLRQCSLQLPVLFAVALDSLLVGGVSVLGVEFGNVYSG